MTPQRGYIYHEFVMAAFVTVLIHSNLIDLEKIVQFDLPLPPVLFRTHQDADEISLR